MYLVRNIFADSLPERSWLVPFADTGAISFTNYGNSARSNVFPSRSVRAQATRTIVDPWQEFMQHSSFASTAPLPRLLSAHTLKPRWLLFSILFGVICSKTSAGSCAGSCVGDSAQKADVGRIKSSLHSRIINHAISGHARKSLVTAELRV